MGWTGGNQGRTGGNEGRTGGNKEWMPGNKGRMGGGRRTGSKKEAFGQSVRSSARLPVRLVYIFEKLPMNLFWLKVFYLLYAT